MIRMVLFALGFIAITVTLVIVQPGAPRRAADAPLSEPAVTRAQPALNAAVLQSQQAVADLPQAAPQPAPVPVPQPRAAAVPAPTTLPDVDDQALRRMTWDTLSSLNQATGRETAPGQPGSLLHTIVRRSLDGVPSGGAAAQPRAEIYVVQSGDSLVSIAERIYGDVNMTGPLFAANQSILTRPDDLRAGQTLVLPKR